MILPTMCSFIDFTRVAWWAWSPLCGRHRRWVRAYNERMRALVGGGS